MPFMLRLQILLPHVLPCQIYNLAGKRAEALSKAPGSFQVNFIDQLYLASADDVAENPFEVCEA